MVAYVIYIAVSALILWSVVYVLKTVHRQWKGKRGCGGCNNCHKDCPSKKKKKKE